MTSDHLAEINKGLDNIADLLVFLNPDKVGLLEDFLKFKARQFYQEAILAPTWDRVVENRAIANYLYNQLGDLRAIVEARRTELEEMKAAIENGDDV